MHKNVAYQTDIKIIIYYIKISSQSSCYILFPYTKSISKICSGNKTLFLYTVSLFKQISIPLFRKTDKVSQQAVINSTRIYNNLIRKISWLHSISLPENNSPHTGQARDLPNGVACKPTKTSHLVT